MLYASESVALACLEVLVRIKNAILFPLDYMYAKFVSVDGCCCPRIAPDHVVRQGFKPRRTGVL